ncbi:glycosyltransferase [Mycolicibacterium sarraceniae]|uniref:Glycosyl transferase family 1 n=1 Tax=Mycolicibacterium sarraceniae TaxID=1534348 RepID=A0A7I7SS20_9MYCO|nr:glycosyltransferase [Mycolicibacterium sarraceniae]BBY59802.1 glycosyl transferase family 1 [Mycolicibacterium sarraceniae]
MKFVLTAYGSRGDVEPAVVVGRELLARGHDVQMAVPPNLVKLAEKVGIEAIPYGLDSQALFETQRRYWTCFFRNPWRMKELDRLGRDIGDFLARCWTEETTRALRSLAEGADLVIAGVGFEQFAANVAEFYGIPLATLHYFPLRANGQVLPLLPAPLGRRALTAYERLSWSGPIKEAEDAQRRELGLAKATCPWPERIADRGALEIQAYDELVFPGVAAEWAKWGSQRPFVGMLTLGLQTDVDEEVSAWIAEGTPPIFFGFGSISVGSAADTLVMISAACAELGERALVCSGWTDFGDLPQFDHVKVVPAVNYATIFPQCRAVVHHGGAGSVAAGLRAGMPTLILWTFPDQPVSGTAIKRLHVGTARRFSTTTRKTLVGDLRRVLAPEYAARAGGIAARMSTPAQSAAAATDLVEDFAGLQRVG